MSGKNTLYAEWDKEEGNFRLFYDSDIQNTIATVNTILEAEQFAESRSENFVLYGPSLQSFLSSSEKQPKRRLFVDMDGTLAEFKIVTYQEQLFEKGYFANLRPHDNVVEAVKDIISKESDIEVFILSAYLTDSDYALREKNEWLDKYVPEIDQEHRVFVPCGTDKKEAIENLSQADYLLDDYTVNLLDWVPPGKAIKLINNINHTHGTWKEDCIRYDRSPDDISELITRVVTGETRSFDTKVGFDVNHPAKASSFDRQLEEKNAFAEKLMNDTDHKLDVTTLAKEQERLKIEMSERKDASYMESCLSAMNEIGYFLSYAPGWSDDGLVAFVNKDYGEEKVFDGFELALSFVNEVKCFQLAVRIDDFMYGLDPYDYNDSVEDREANIRTIKNELSEGKTEYYMDLLSNLEADGYYIENTELLASILTDLKDVSENMSNEVTNNRHRGR